MLKHTFGVSWWIGILFSQKKVTENHETLVGGLGYVSAKKR